MTLRTRTCQPYQFGPLVSDIYYDVWRIMYIITQKHLSSFMKQKVYHREGHRNVYLQFKRLNLTGVCFSGLEHAVSVHKFSDLRSQYSYSYSALAKGRHQVEGIWLSIDSPIPPPFLTTMEI